MQLFISLFYFIGELGTEPRSQLLYLNLSNPIPPLSVFYLKTNSFFMCLSASLDTMCMQFPKRAQEGSEPLELALRMVMNSHLGARIY